MLPPEVLNSPDGVMHYSAPASWSTVTSHEKVFQLYTLLSGRRDGHRSVTCHGLVNVALFSANNAISSRMKQWRNSGLTVVMVKIGLVNLRTV